MARSRDWKSEYQVEYVRHCPDRNAGQLPGQTYVLSGTPTVPSIPNPVVGALMRSRRAEATAAVPPEDPLDRGFTEYTTEYVDHGAGVSGELIKHPDHRDIFRWRDPRTGKTTSATGHSRAASVLNPNYSQNQDYSMDRPDPDITKRQKIEQLVDVNPFKPRYRTDPGKQDTTYRTYFRNFFPAPPDPRYSLSSRLSGGGDTFAEAQRPRTSLPDLRSQINQFPFDIESRKLMEVPDDINSTYRTDYVDFEKTPARRSASRRPRTTAAIAIPASQPFVDDKDAEFNAHDFSVRPGGLKPSTIYRDNYVNFMKGHKLRTLND
jgi:hypothetical protein